MLSFIDSHNVPALREHKDVQSPYKLIYIEEQESVVQGGEGTSPTSST